MQAYHKYLLNDGIELFTVVCLPAEKGKFPTVIFRTPYVDESEMVSNDVICEKKLADSLCVDYRAQVTTSWLVFTAYPVKRT